MNTTLWTCIFWVAATIICYTYFGYPLWLWLRSQWRPLPVHRDSFLPFISIVLVVRNEQDVLDKKLQSLLSLPYGTDQMEIVVVSDASSDGTVGILKKYCSEPKIRYLLTPDRRGKAGGLNDAIALARGEIVIFTDARQVVEANAVRYLLENFADPSVGCVTGDLLLGDPACSDPSRGLGIYWRLEKKMWELESLSGSAVGVTGAFYAARRECLPVLPAETVLDDVYIPMAIARQGKRVVLESRAKAWDAALFAPAQEWTRKVRTLSGNYQLLRLQPWLLSHSNPLRFEFISHRLLRLAVPFLLMATLIATIILPGPLYRLALGLQLGFYVLSAANFAPLKNNRVARLAHSAFIFVLMNAAAAAALAKLLTRRQIAWKN